MRSTGWALVLAMAPGACGGAPAGGALPVTASALGADEQAARAFLGELSAGHPEAAAARFDETMGRVMPVAELASLWRRLEAAGGAFAEVESTRVELAAPHRVVHATCRFARLRKVIRVVFDPAGHVAGLFFGPVPATVEGEARGLVEALSKGDWAAAGRSFDPTMRAAMPAEKLAALWKTLGEQAGPFAGIERTVLKAEGGVWPVVVVCRFARARLAVRVVFDVEDRVAGLFIQPAEAAEAWKPPPYAQPASFTELAVTVGTAPALPGTLTLPKGDGPFPAVVLVHGSGPNDADETVGANKVFKDLAWGLASRGVAVLRYVKRTRADPRGVVTVKEEFVDGALAAIDLLLSRREIDPRKVVLAGHSQGGSVAPRIARERPALAGVVLLAGATRPIQDSIVEQLAYFHELEPGDEHVTKLLTEARVFKAQVERADLAPDDMVAVPSASPVKAAYFLDLRGYRPAEAAAALGKPILVVQGGRDYQVTAPDLDGWKAALGGRAGVTFKVYPALNHLFIAGEGRSTPAEYERPGHVDEAMVTDLAAWIVALPR